MVGLFISLVIHALPLFVCFYLDHPVAVVQDGPVEIVDEMIEMEPLLIEGQRPSVETIEFSEEESLAIFTME